MVLLYSLSGLSQNHCSTSYLAFKEGEQLNYIVSYNLGILMVKAGEASSTVTLKKNSKPVYHFDMLGKSFPQYNWFFSVNDRYEAYADTLSLKPCRFVREVHEDNYFAYDDYIFNHRNNNVYLIEKRNNKKIKLDTILLSGCVKDVVTAIYYFRCLDFTRYAINDTIPITLLLDGEVSASYIRYMGKEVIDTELFGKVRCIKLKPKLIEGTIFNAGEGMSIWITDDLNRLPVYVETEILVGAIKIKLVKYNGLRNKIDCYVPK